MHHRPRALAAALVVTAVVFAALAAAAQPRQASVPAAAARGGPAGAAGKGAESGERPAPLVAAPVRIADAEAVRLLRPGDRVDVLAAPVSRGPTGLSADLGGERPAGPARVVARRARVAEVPARAEGAPPAAGPAASGEGALLVLSVTPETAAELAGAAVGSRLAVARW